jgi:hypothetical protein
LVVSEFIAQSLKPAIILADSFFRPENSRTALLCIEIGRRTMRFCVVRAADKYCCWLEDYALEVQNEESFAVELEKIITRHPLLSRTDWEEVRVSVNDADFTLVPTAWFRENYSEEYLKMVLGVGDLGAKSVMNGKVAQIDSFSIFSVPAKWADLLKQYYGNSRLAFYHTTTTAVAGALTNNPDTSEKKTVSLSVEDEYITVVVCENRRLVLCNRFHFSGHQELTYLILFTLNQLNYLPEDVTLLLYGEVTPFSENYKELSQFIPYLYLGKKPSAIKYCEAFDDIPDHRFNTLLNTALVVS